VRAIYLDNNASTRCDPAVVDAMLPFFSSEYGNSGSQHIMGRRAAGAVARAREMVASLAGCSPSEIVFTSGATESCNLAVLGATSEMASRRTIVTSAVEHKAVLGPCELREDHGVKIHKVPVLPSGILSLDMMADAVSDGPFLVSVQAANNEVGVVQPVEEIADIAHSGGALFHCDAAQMLGKLPFDVSKLGIDLASFSAHKLYGPKGIGALYVSNRIRQSLRPVLAGGGQEAGLRPGTVNVPAVVGFGEACCIALEKLEQEAHRLSGMRDLLETDLLGCIPRASVNSREAPRLPGTTSITLPSIPADLLIANVPTVCFSNGSACTSGTLSPSHVLVSMGLSRDEADCTIRLSVGRWNTVDDVREAASLLGDAVHRLRGEL
jgi:cysteine desulfurase